MSQEISFTFPAEVVDRLEQIKERTGLKTVTEVVRAALSEFDVATKQRALGAHLCFLYPDGVVLRIRPDGEIDCAGVLGESGDETTRH